MTPASLPAANGPDCVFGDLTWRRLEEVLISHAKGQDAQLGVRHLLNYARTQALVWDEAELCIELVSIVAMALQRSRPSALVRCGTLSPDFAAEASTMT